MGGLLQRVRGLLGGAAPPAQSGTGETQGTDASKALAFTQDKWNDLKNAYVVIHQAIWETFLFYANQSWIKLDDARKTWVPSTPSDEWVPNPRINRFSPTIDAVTSNFSALPQVEATPKHQNSPPEAHLVAQVCCDLIDWAVQKEGLKSQQGESLDKVGLAAQLFVLSGGLFSILRADKKDLGQTAQQGMGPAMGYQCQTCDKYVQTPGTEAPNFCATCGAPVDPEETEMMQDQTDPDTGQPAMQDMSENEIKLEIGNMLFAFPRAGATSLEDSPFLLWAQRRTLDDIWGRWQFEATPDSVWPDGYSVTYEHALNFWYTGYSSSTLQMKDSCMVLEMYASPNKLKDFQEGFHQVVINDRSVKLRNWDYPENPLTMGGYLTLPTIFFPRSIAFDCVELQRETNAYESLIKLHSMVSAVDPWIVDQDSLISEITGRADKIIKYRKLGPDTEPPHRAGAGQLDEGVYKKLEMLHSEFQNVSMAVNAFRGQQEGGITAAAAVQQLRSQAELMFSKPANNWRNFWRETLRKYVKFVQKFYTMPQLVEILGPDREDEIRAFMKSDLDNVVEFVASDHGLPRTKDDLRQEMLMMFDKGALDINDPAVKQKAFELFGETGMMDSFNKDATNARLENQEFKTGTGDPNNPQAYVPPKIEPMHPPLEDNAVHLYFHCDQVKSQDFKKWNPKAQEALIQHVMETQLLMMPTPVPAPAPGAPPPGQPGKTTQGQNPDLGKPTPVQSAQ